MKYFIYLIISFLIILPYNLYSQESNYTLRVGNYNNPQIWSEKHVPTKDEIVAIKHHILIDGNIKCKQLTIRNSGILYCKKGASKYSISVENDLINDGKIYYENAYPLKIICKGKFINNGALLKNININCKSNFENNGKININEIIFGSKEKQQIKTIDDTLLCNKVQFLFNNQIQLESDFIFKADSFNINTAEILLNNYKLSIVGSIIYNGKLTGKGKLDMSENAIADSVNFKNLNLYGKCQLRGNNIFHDEIVVDGKLMICDTYDYYDNIILGKLINNGYIFSNQYLPITFILRGDIDCSSSSDWFNVEIKLDGEKKHRITAESQSKFNNIDIKSLNPTEILQLEKEPYFKNSSIDMNHGKLLIYGNTTALYLKEKSLVKNAQIEANNNTISLTEKSKLDSVVVSNIVFDNEIYISKYFEIKGDTKINKNSVLKLDLPYESTLIINGKLINEGVFENITAYLVKLSGNYEIINHNKKLKIDKLEPYQKINSN